MLEHEGNARLHNLTVSGLSDRRNMCISGALRSEYSGWVKLRSRPIPIRLCFGYSLDLTGALPPNFPITPTFPWLHSPLHPPPTMQKPPNAADFCPPPDAAGL
jgi:hypothetical protein